MTDLGGTRALVTGATGGLGLVRRCFAPYGPSGAVVELLSQVMPADLADGAVTVNLPRLLDPAIMGPPNVWPASPEAAGVHDQRIVADEFEQWLAAR